MTEVPDDPRPEGCFCPVFTDTGGYRIADLNCPWHGLHGSHPGDGYWDEDDYEDVRAEERR